MSKSGFWAIRPMHDDLIEACPLRFVGDGHFFIMTGNALITTLESLLEKGPVGVWQFDDLDDPQNPVQVFPSEARA